MWLDKSLSKAALEHQSVMHINVQYNAVHKAQTMDAELFSLSTHSELIHTSVSHPTESMLKTCELCKVPGTSIPHLTITDNSDMFKLEATTKDFFVEVNIS